MRWENKGYSEDEIRKRIKKLRRDMMTKFVSAVEPAWKNALKSVL